MGLAKESWPEAENDATALQVYMLGTVDFDALLRFQRRLHYEIAGQRNQAALILCEHSSLITVGRQGSRAHILIDPRELMLRGWPIRWVNRGGGCWLHQPGQLAAYALVPLDRYGLTVPVYMQRLAQVVARWLGDFDVRNEVRDGGVWVGERLLAGLGVAVRHWVSYYGLCLNIHPVLDDYRWVRSSAKAHEAMTSLERERRGRVRPSLARQRFIEHFQESFGFSRLSLFTEHPALRGSMERSSPPRVATQR